MGWFRCVIAVLAISATGGALAQAAYPAKAVRILVQYPPGGAPDLTARTLAQHLSASLGQPFVVENRPGANGNIATEAVARSSADGYTLLLSSDGPIVINPSLYKSLPFDPLRDLTPVVLATSAAFYLLAARDFPANTVQELITLVRQHPTKYSYASSGYGSQHHLAGELLKNLGGINLLHVPYKGYAPAVADVMGGKIELCFGSVPAALGVVEGGKVKALAVTGRERFAGTPEIPTMIESGLRDFEIRAWFGLMAPSGTPRPVIEQLYKESARALQLPEIRKRFVVQGLDIHASGPEEFAARIRSDEKMWSGIIKVSGAKLD